MVNDTHTRRRRRVAENREKCQSLLFYTHEVQLCSFIMSWCATSAVMVAMMTCVLALLQSVSPRLSSDDEPLARNLQKTKRKRRTSSSSSSLNDSSDDAVDEAAEVCQSLIIISSLSSLNDGSDDAVDEAAEVCQSLIIIIIIE